LIGNAAAPQNQLDVYGHFLHTAWLYADSGGALDIQLAARLAETADLVASIWRETDSGIWEVRSEPAHFTESKMMCWVALDRAMRLAEGGYIPAGHAAQWQREATAIRRFVAERSWSRERGSYLRYPGSDGTDAGILLPALLGYGRGADRERMLRTIEHVRDQLGAGPFVYRYRGEDGLPGEEGAFLACSFWLVDALARLGEPGEAAELMEELVAAANDVGLYAEEIDPTNGDFLGNFPQGLVHLALIGAATTVAEVSR
jgi:GH15 family glucan-1,4-alpha-glucosidase